MVLVINIRCNVMLILVTASTSGRSARIFRCGDRFLVDFFASYFTFFGSAYLPCSVYRVELVATMGTYFAPSADVVFGAHLS